MNVPDKCICGPAPQLQLPTLPWQQMSDWINVKMLGAKGTYNGYAVAVAVEKGLFVDLHFLVFMIVEREFETYLLLPRC